jgi:hypothetical protein
MNTKALLSVALFVAAMPAMSVSVAADFFVSATGNDDHDGAARDRSWKTIARANRQALDPGDRLLFRGGDSFEGSVVIQVARPASAKMPMTVGAWGNGRATILPGNAAGLRIENTGGIVVRDLILKSNDRRKNKASGVQVVNALPNGETLDFIRIENVDASGFGKYGIAVSGAPADNSQSGFRDIRITGCRAFDNAYVGIHVFGVHDYYAKTYAHRDVSIIDCIAHDNPGDPDYLDNHSGNGILLHDVNGGLIDRCTAYGNGALCGAKSGGPVGIWAWSSRKLVIQNCVSVRNRTNCDYDGGGFDFDGGVSDSIMQYNYSAENDGAGYLVYDFGAAPFRLADNVIRFNVSENDGRKNGYAGIYVSSLGNPVERLHVYHNTVSLTPSPGQKPPAALFVHKSKDSRFHNNLLIARATRLGDIGSDQTGLRILGNHYWPQDDRFLVQHGEKQCRSLAEWRKHAEVERLSGKDVGSVGAPKFAISNGDSILLKASQRTTLTRYKLSSDSPLVGAGLDLRSLFSLDAGELDFWHNKFPRDRRWSIGAFGG